MNNYLNYPNRKFSANGKTQPSAGRETQQDVEVLAARGVRQHGDVGQGTVPSLFWFCAGKAYLRSVRCRSKAFGGRYCPPLIRIKVRIVQVSWTGKNPWWA